LNRFVQTLRKVPFALFLAGLTLAVYGRVAGYPFVDLDDQVYVFGNPNVSGGLSAGGVAWAFTTFWGANWHPLAWLSHMLDVSLFGMRAGGHHVVSVLIHASNAALLFALLRRTTGSVRESGLVAILFAIHPLHVESVAWISERKDVLCAFFFLLALIAYARYRERPGPWRYGLVAWLYALALMAKPMAVTLPFVLLLLDRWPLRAGFSRALLLEKAPLFLMSAAASVVTLLAQASGEAVASASHLPPAARFLNAAHAYAGYLQKAFWPSGLSVFYPLPRFTGDAAKALVPALALAAVTAAAIACLRRRPWLAVGWFWFLGMLVPVIGLVQVGMQGMADRYFYLPSIGLFVAVAWGGGELAERLKVRGPALAAIVLVPLALLAASAWHQVGSWSDSATLYRRAAEAVPGNWFAHKYLATEAARHGRREEALGHLARVLEAGAGYNDYQYAIFREHGGEGAAEAGEYLASVEAGIRADAEKMREIGLSKAEAGRLGEAEHFLRLSVRLFPRYAEGHYDLAVALARLGRNDEALPHFREALRIAPVDADACNRIGVALLRLGRVDESLPFFRAALRFDPGHEDAGYNLEKALARAGRGKK
jgi:hypothetical protein